MNEELIISSIRTIINQFRRKPDNFFNEYDFHHYFYHVFYSKKEFSKQYITGDGKKTIVLHPEYPTLKRFRRKPTPQVDKENGKRARYDMAILKPEFIEKYKYKTIRCRDITKTNSIKNKENLFAVIEFKYIIRQSRSCIKEIQFDSFKLQHADEAEHKYLLVFSKIHRNEIKYLEEINLHPSIKAAYIYPNNGEKRNWVEENPKGWLTEKRGEFNG
jgi:hypothetical protein